MREYGWRGSAAKQEMALPKVYILAKHRPALAETEGRGRALCLRANRCAATADGMGWGRRISQIGHRCRSAALAPSPLCPRSLLRETDCVQTRGANRILMRRSKKHLYSITSSAKQDSWDRLLRDLGVDHALPRAIVIEFTIRYTTRQQSVGLRNCARACNEPHSVRKSGARHARDWLVACAPSVK